MSKSILVSAGHGAQDPGAVGNGFKEADIALQLRDKTARILRDKGATVFEDGADGVNEPLNKAIGIARTVTRAGGVAVEFHMNASVNAKADGIECLSKNTKPLVKLSQDLCRAVQSITGGTLRGSDGGWKSDSSGQHHRLGFCNAGGVILELGFISNPNEAKLIASNLDAIALKIATVLLNHAGVAEMASVKVSPVAASIPQDNQSAPQPTEQGGQSVTAAGEAITANATVEVTKERTSSFAKLKTSVGAAITGIAGLGLSYQAFFDRIAGGITFKHVFIIVGLLSLGGFILWLHDRSAQRAFELTKAKVASAKDPNVNTVEIK